MRPRARGGFTDDMASNGTPGEQRCIASLIDMYPLEDCSGALAALRRLSPDHRQILLDVGVLRQPANVIAARLDLPVGTVRSRLHYAMHELHGELAADCLLWNCQ